MSLILSIESGTEVCSVGIARDGEIISLRESSVGRDHARLVGVFAQELLEQSGVRAEELSAVAVGKGPGSYTGLRIGVSFAKGLCYGLNIPLIGVGSLEALTQVAIENHKAGILGVEESEWSSSLLAPMVDARRMEVYTQLFSSEGVSAGEVEAKVIDEGAFEELRGERPLLMFGDGAAKCKDILPWARVVDVVPSASGVARLAHQRFERGEVEDVAYFEPFYLKDFVVTESKKRYF